MAASLGFQSTFEVFSDLKKFDNGDFKAILNNSSPNDQSNNYPTNIGRYINVCYGKEWYRYPSSFFLPSTKTHRMRFIKSDFKGQLPKLYESEDSKYGRLKTRIIYEDFNDMNKEETSRYVTPEQCHYLIDSSGPSNSENEPDYSKNTKDWTILSSHKMLDLNNSPVIIRSFYLPYISERKNSYTLYQLLRNNNLFSQIRDNKQPVA